ITHIAPETGTFLEIGPDPILTTATQHTLHHLTNDDAAEYPAPLVTATLTHKQPDTHALTRTLAQLHTTGTTIDWTAWYPTTPPPHTLELPTYAFQRQRYWLAPPAHTVDGDDTEHGDPVEAQLWNAIEEQDVDALTATLRLDKDSPGIDALLPALPVLSTWRRQHREQSAIDAWRYRIAWQHLTESAASPALTGTWLLIVPSGLEDHPAVHVAAEAIRSHGADHTTLAVDGAALHGDDLARQLRDVTAEFMTAGILSLLGLDESPHPEHPSVPIGLAATTVLVQALSALEDTGGPLWCLTQGAVATAATDPLPHPHQAQIWGFGRVAALEHPRLWGGLIDLPTAIDDGTPVRIARCLIEGQPEDQIAIRSGTFVRRLEHAPATDPASALAANGWRPSGTTLVTGGTGGLGAHVARWLAHHGAPRLQLVSRGGPDAPGATELTEELTALGTEVTVTACDVSDREALRELLGTIPAEHPLTSVIHAAGIPENAPLTELELAHVDDVLRPKALAAAHLHELTRHLDLSAFVLFSSGAAAWGSSRQASYAAANAYLDALAGHRRAQGLPATSLAWAPWSEAGMAADDAVIEYYHRRGMRPLTTDLAIKSLQRALDQDDTCITIADIDWRTFPAGFTAQRPSPLLSSLAPSAPPNAETADSAATSGALRQQLADGTPAQQHHLLLRHIQTHAAAILGHSGIDAVPPSQPFQELGFDSLTAVEFGTRLSATTGVDLPPTLIFDHPTPREMADFLRERLVDTDVSSSEGRLLSELDRWDSVSEPSAVDTSARRRIAGRLHLLLAKWDDTERESGRTTAHSELETATAEDIFELISDEFGKS
ncbi:SDR family NAD(P)-dependent oxidoreductase, partial [Streptomyces sp. NPDC048636]|uniref:SDR family NAD(P)-dependent oxidoreductase n=1 Tax=Streptomyces sp. NPDC048636 TaxID=3155762 RepID=UPI003440FEEA